jgi:hypothetical protein
MNHLWRNEVKKTKAGVVIKNSTFEREARMGFLPPTVYPGLYIFTLLVNDDLRLDLINCFIFGFSILKVVIIGCSVRQE